LSVQERVNERSDHLWNGLIRMMRACTKAYWCLCMHASVDGNAPFRNLVISD
jgi:hypothetical protein